MKSGITLDELLKAYGDVHEGDESVDTAEGWAVRLGCSKDTLRPLLRRALKDGRAERHPVRVEAVTGRVMTCIGFRFVDKEQ